MGMEGDEIAGATAEAVCPLSFILLVLPLPLSPIFFKNLYYLNTITYFMYI